MKLLISKSRDGNGYYTKVQNDYNGKHTEKYLSLQLPKGTEIEYGLYEVDGFLSTYEKKDGSVEFKLVVTDVRPAPKNDSNSKEKNTLPKDPFEEFGEHIKTKVSHPIEINTDDLPF